MGDIRKDKLKMDENVATRDIDRYSYDLGLLFKAFADHTRVRILCLLLKQETCVQDIVEQLAFSQSAVSHQLALLRNMRLVKSRREGKTVYYSLDDDHVETILLQGLEHLSHGTIGLK